MVTYRQVCDALERALEQHGPDARTLAGAVAALAPSQHRAVAYEDVLDKLRTSVWSPRCACELAVTAWWALPLEVRCRGLQSGHAWTASTGIRSAPRVDGLPLWRSGASLRLDRPLALVRVPPVFARPARRAPALAAIRAPAGSLRSDRGGRRRQGRRSSPVTPA